MLLNAKIVDLIELNVKKTPREIKLVQINSELGAGTRGASKGVSGLLKAAMDKDSFLFEQYETIIVPHSNDALWEPVRYQYAKKISPLLDVFCNVSKSVKSICSEKSSFPVVLAGDHSTALGSIAGIKAAFPNKRLGVIWIDAHADIHTPYTTPSGNMHGMPIAASLGIDNILSSSNDPHHEVVSLWERVKSIEGISPKVSPQDIAYVGVRDTEWQEDKLIKELGINTVSVEDLQNQGVEEIVQQVLDKLKNTDMIYISYDVDALDPNLSTGTGTPVEKGLSLQDAKGLIKGLIASPKIVCFEMVEINPSLDDKGNKMAEMAFEVLEIVVDQFK